MLYSTTCYIPQPFILNDEPTASQHVERPIGTKRALKGKGKVQEQTDRDAFFRDVTKVIYYILD